MIMLELEDMVKNIKTLSDCNTNEEVKEAFIVSHKLLEEMFELDITEGDSLSIVEDIYEEFEEFIDRVWHICKVDIMNYYSK